MHEDIYKILLQLSLMVCEAIWKVPAVFVSSISQPAKPGSVGTTSLLPHKTRSFLLAAALLRLFVMPLLDTERKDNTLRILPAFRLFTGIELLQHDEIIDVDLELEVVRPECGKSASSQ